MGAATFPDLWQWLANLDILAASARLASACKSSRALGESAFALVRCHIRCNIHGSDHFTATPLQLHCKPAESA